MGLSLPILFPPLGLDLEGERLGGGLEEHWGWGWEEPCSGCEGESPGKGVCLAQPARLAWLPGRCATNVVDAGSLETQSQCLCLTGTVPDFTQTKADRLSNLDREANSSTPFYRVQSQRRVKANIYAQNRRSPAGLVGFGRGGRSLDRLGQALARRTSPSSTPRVASTWGMEWTPQSQHIFHPGITLVLLPPEGTGLLLLGKTSLVAIIG